MTRKHLNRKLLHRASFAFSILMLCLAIWTLHEALDDYTYSQIVHAIGGISQANLAVAILLTALSYAIMTFYDKLALDYLETPLKFRRIAMASFISYAIGNNAGQAALSGGAVRLRMYSAYGLSPLQIAKIIGFTVFTFWIGFLALAGSAFVLDPLPIPAGMVLFVESSRPIGVLFLFVVVGYLAACAWIRREVRMFGHSTPLPNFKIAFAQVVVSAFDMMLSCAAFYWLLPSHPDLGFAHFLGIYMLAMFLGLASMVPGGLGVFEAVLLLLVKPYLDSTVLLGTLIAYRLIFFLLPLAIAALGLVLFESRAIRREGIFGWFRRIQHDSEVVEEAAEALLGTEAEAAKYDACEVTDEPHELPEPQTTHSTES